MPTAVTGASAVTIAKRNFVFGRAEVEQRMRGTQPEPIVSHYVVIGDRRFPPKQVIIAMTGLDRADFTTHHARRILTRLGFAAGRQTREDAFLSEPQLRGRGDRVASSMRPSAQTLEPFLGQWVATRGAQVLVAAEDPRTIVSWLAEHHQKAESMFRVPEEHFQATGAAPA